MESVEQRSGPKRSSWDSKYFGEYMYALPRGRDFLLPRKDYPFKIDLGADLHDILNRIRKDSIDGIERYSIIGYKQNTRDLIVPTVAAEGMPDHIPSDVIATEIQKAKDIVGIEGVIGDIHSHPRELVKYLWGYRGYHVAFSAGDFYGMLLPGNFVPLRIVVEGNENLLAFLTRESSDIGVNSGYFNQGAFEKYWYEKNGFRYLGFNLGEKRAEPLPTANHWGVNTGIAQKHNLVLYKGRVNRDAVRVFPAS